MTHPILSATNLTKTYGSTQALVDVSLQVYPGESVAIMGPSGSGKTTLMHCLSGILVPDTGKVHLTIVNNAATDITQLNEEQRAQLRREHLGFVFQDGLLLPELTAQENTALPLMLSGVPRNTAETQARNWLSALGLDGLYNRRLGQLSGGQAQRVAIARAQIAEPSVVFADEPTGALDSETSETVLTALLDSTVSRGRALVLVTHDESVAARCQRLIHVSDGRIIQILQILQELPDESYNNGKPSVPVTPVCDPPGLVAAGGSLCRSGYLGTERGRWDTFLFHTQ